MVDSVTGTGISQYQSAGDKSAATLANDFDDFLVLLTTQLQHQDPMDPMDSNQFTEQLVQFSGVEQQIKTNQNLETLASLTMMNHQSSMAGYLGKDALVPGIYGTFDAASTKGQDEVQWRYNLPSEASEATIEVRNSDGAVVYKTSADRSVGTHDFIWNGELNGGGVAEPGTYNVKIVAKDTEGSTMDVGIAVRGEIESVDLTDTEALFKVGENYVYQTDIVQLYQK
ncbi:flagellar hook assembly protein FlgD [Kordiimonas aestuarii]|uniref:flagellar hook assembly protein FlgD n=1 Tax=Kordiimonas aestuarii TaxID=1005925 RepID=UPI0021D31677|nr:flagellar hook capping FlgD N-terminal domain-containing protein [Kordiimonas aestuarii]